MGQDEKSPEVGNSGAHALQRGPGPVVVGIGPSAGGLAALKTFFEHVPDDSGLSFVVVMHLWAQHESHLADLLQFRVKIPVQQVTETTEMLPNRVYVIPPGYNISAIDTHLRLTRLEGRRQERAPIDHFFRTRAATHDGHAIGVILTGTGSDGTIGVKDVKEKGGLVVVQDPNEAEYDGMPQSAIATGLAAQIRSLRPTSTNPRSGEPANDIIPPTLSPTCAPTVSVGSSRSRTTAIEFARRFANRSFSRRTMSLPILLSRGWI